MVFRKKHQNFILSATGNARPARCNKPPKSRISPIGAIRGDIPFNILVSAYAKGNS